ncbi:hypothetical protein OG520_39150 [Streptomyces sp. NBC_00984]|uniref:hypothetical protein n=1 Tax=Streptomyces sp. NBC_00984 TaxID=2903700 RepID=UPI00386E7C68|nr:hypothetical protein OG520_39150 [Streptomyces sp. NBC_00984]
MTPTVCWSRPLSAEIAITRPSEIAVYAKAFAELQQLAVFGAPARALIRAAIEAIVTNITS